MAKAYLCDMCGKYFSTSRERDGSMDVWWYDPVTKDLGATTFDICPRCAERIKAEMNDVRMRNGLLPIPCNMQKAGDEF